MPVPTYDQFIEPLLPSGAQPIYRNRAGWAHDRLKRAGLSSSPRRGSWQITEAGREFLERHPQPLPAEVARELAMGYVDVRLRPAAEAGGEVSSAAVASPDDRLGEALQELRGCMPWAMAPAAVICSGWGAPVMAALMG
jgi:restriction system protein